MANALSTWNVSERTVLCIIGSGVGLSLFPTEGRFFIWWESHAIEWMWLLFIMGFFFFFFNRSRLMVIAFTGCAVLCYVLDERMDTTLRPATSTSGAFSLRIGAFQFAPIDAATDSTLMAILATNVDVLSLEGIPSGQIRRVHQFFEEQGYSFSRFEPYQDRMLELAIFSRYPLEFSTIIRHPTAPSILARLKIPLPDSLSQLTFLGTVLPDSKKEYAAAKGQLEALGVQLSQIQTPKVAMGNFQLVGWSFQLQAFKRRSALRDSRRGIRPTSRQGFLTLFEQSTDYIFYSNHFQCISFETISSSSGHHMGIIGIYQLTKGRAYVQQTSQEL